MRARWGWKAIVSKQKDLPYRSGRGEHWLKIKCVQAQELYASGEAGEDRRRVRNQVKPPQGWRSAFSFVRLTNGRHIGGQRAALPPDLGRIG